MSNQPESKGKAITANMIVQYLKKERDKIDREDRKRRSLQTILKNKGVITQQDEDDVEATR